MNQWNYLELEIGILVSLLKQWNGFEDFNILNFSKILLKFAIVFKIFDNFCLFAFSDHCWPTIYAAQVLQMGYLT